ncbi:hypothetical protein AMJ44_07915 [candidate division WOR-1 bacterium DG_54_3]|uniref:Uncharacterized protein n=1 Tax=candidate division WOR-1 bacterium DG_54_3 TaxID=1703775 RepID=A0A0S7XWD6_UNCSA|nr:MAG: hypothetical protein AMJ44_07915 [candidate division WOR-1 bacterium DG_54_3]
MPALSKYLDRVDFQDKQFVGTITLKSEEIALPDGSKMALGIDDGLWMLVYQKAPHAPFKAFKYIQPENKILVDQKPGGEGDLKDFKKLVKYFFTHAKVEDLVTLLPPAS